MLGLYRYRVAISAPDPEWAREFRVLASEIGSATSGIDLKVEHIGSTSVSGLPAKPVVDLAILLAAPEAFPRLESALRSTNLEYRGDKGPQGGRLFVRESAPAFRTHHVHVYFRGAPEWEKYLVFRDRLRSSGSLRAEYANLKEQLAKRFSDDPAAYMAGKSEFVAFVLAQRP
jgi:GrpB-like predicted nucleotidyltransferase (UPF0157 family)